MSEPAVELPADDAPLARAAEDARRGVATHLTIHGERVAVAVIMPEGVIDALREVAALLTNERIASYLPSLLPRAMSWTSSLPETDLPVFISELAAAGASGRDAPEKVAAVLREWQATAEKYADPREAARLRQALQEAREGKAMPGSTTTSSRASSLSRGRTWILLSARTARPTARSTEDDKVVPVQVVRVGLKTPTGGGTIYEQPAD